MPNFSDLPQELVNQLYREVADNNDVVPLLDFWHSGIATLPGTRIPASQVLLHVNRRLRQGFTSEILRQRPGYIQFDDLARDLPPHLAGAITELHIRIYDRHVRGPQAAAAWTDRIQRLAQLPNLRRVKIESDSATFRAHEVAAYQDILEHGLLVIRGVSIHWHSKRFEWHIEPSAAAGAGPSTFTVASEQLRRFYPPFRSPVRRF